MDKITYSIITVNLNNRDGLRKTIESVARQTFRDYEFIVIDGASTDGSVDVIRQNAERITRWVSEKDSGIYNAMNKGVRMAEGEYCLFLNSGDTLHGPEALAAVREKDYTEDFISCDIVYEGTDISCTKQHADLSFLDLYRDTLSHQSTFIRTSLLREMPYNESLRISADWEFWVKALVLRDSTVVFDKTILSEFNRDGISSTNHELASKERQQIFEALIPPRILKDYKKLRLVDDRFIQYGGMLSRKGRLKKSALFLLKILSRL